MKEQLTIEEIVEKIQSYNEEGTIFQVANDIFGHSCATVPMRVAIDRLNGLNTYWSRQEIPTTFCIWKEENMKVWSDTRYEFEFKNVVSITANNSKISEFALNMNTLND